MLNCFLVTLNKSQHSFAHVAEDSGYLSFRWAYKASEHFIYFLNTVTLPIASLT